MSLENAFHDQARACAGLGSPFMARLCELLAQEWRGDTPLGRACAAFDGDLGPGGHSLPLRIAGGLHALVLQGDADLRAVYPPNTPSDTALLAGIGEAFDRHAAFLVDWIQSPPQTNEVRRSAALILAAHWIAARHPLPFRLSELGASGGLNLNFDRFALEAGGLRLGPADAALTLRPEWRGGRPPPPQPFHVTDRAGVDLRPLRADRPEDALRLSAFLWADQPERLQLTRAALALPAARVDQADAIAWLEHRLDEAEDGAVHMIYHTIAWQYFPSEAQARGRSLIEAAGARATETRPLAWFGMENDGAAPGAALRLCLWPGDVDIALGRADFHGRWIDWQAPDPEPRSKET